MAGAAAIVGGSVGLSVALNTVSSNITAYVDNSNVTSTGGQISIGASSSDSVNTLSVATSVAAALGAAGAGAGASAMVNPAVDAYEGSGATLSATRNISVTAGATNSATATTFGIAAGFLAIGGSIATTSADGSTSAHIDGVVTGCANLTVMATANDSSDALAFALAGGIIAGSGAAATATTAPDVMAAINNNSTITSTGTVLVNAQQTPQASAESIGVDVGGVSIGVNVSIATVSGTTSSYLGNSVSISAASLSVDATRSATENSQADAGAGGVLAGINATVSTAQAEGTVQATTGTAVMLPNGNVSIDATSTSDQSAMATGVAIGGILALGADAATANSSVTTTAQLGAGVLTSSSRSGALTVAATGTDQNNASSTAGSGGLIAGDVSVGDTNDTSTVSATLGGPLASGTMPAIFAGTVNVSANNNSKFTPNVTSANAAVAGASGAAANNTDNIAANATILSNTVIMASSAVDVTAQNTFTENLPTNGTTIGNTVTAGAGGFLNGTAAVSDTNLTGNADVTIGSLVTIWVESTSTNSTGTSGIFLTASSVLNTQDQVALSAGGALEGGGTNSSLTANLINTVATSSTSGGPDNFTTNQNIGIGTDTQVNAANTSTANTFGFAGALASARATTDVTSNQILTLGPDTNLTAYGNISLTAGDDANPADSNPDTSMLGFANAQSYARGFIGIPIAHALTTLASNASLSVGSGDQIESGQNITLAADHGAPIATATGIGHGYELWIIPIKTGGTATGTSMIPEKNSDSSASSPTTSTVTINGTVTAGIFDVLNINIPNVANSGIFSTEITANGVTTPNVNNVNNVPYLAPFTNPDLAYPAFSGGSLMSSFTASFDPTFNPYQVINQSNLSPTDQMVLDGEVVPQGDTVGAIQLGSLTAFGGNVTVNAATLSGTGTVTAYGAPSINIINNSPDYLIVNAINISPLLAGDVDYTGAAGAKQAASSGLTIASLNNVAAGASPVVNIQETYTQSVGSSSFGPAVFISGEVENLRGQVSIADANGSVVQLSPIQANQVAISAPNGALVIDTPGQTVVTGQSPYSQYDSEMIWPGGNPDTTPGPNLDANLAVAFVANSMFNDLPEYGDDSSIAADNTALTKALIGKVGDTPSSSLLTAAGTNDAPSTPVLEYLNDDGTQVPEAGTSIVFFGTNTGSNASVSSSTNPDPVTETDAKSESPVGQYYQMNSSNEGYFPVVPVEPTFQQSETFTAKLKKGSTSITTNTGPVVFDGEPVSGNGIQPGTTVLSFTASGNNGKNVAITLSLPETLTGSDESITLDPLPSQPTPVTFTGTLTAGSNLITNLSSNTAGLAVGEAVTITGTSGGLPAGTTIQSISYPTYTLETNSGQKDGVFFSNGQGLDEDPALGLTDGQSYPISGPGIPDGTTITVKTSHGYPVYSLSNAATATGDMTDTIDAIPTSLSLSAAATVDGSVAETFISGSSALNAGKVLITAAIIDVDGTINVGLPNNWSVDLPSSLNSTIQADQSLYTHNPLQSLFSLPVSTVSSSDNQITAQFDAATNQIIVNNVNASSGAGYLSLAGRIMSTNLSGDINVNDGNGQVTIDNETNIPVVVNNVNAGIGSLSSTPPTEVVITDLEHATTTPPNSAQLYVQTVYVYHPGGAITTYQGAATADGILASGSILQPVSNPSGTTGTSTIYTPMQNLHYYWSVQATLTRTVTSVPSNTLSPWSFQNPNDP